MSLIHLVLFWVRFIPKGFFFFFFGANVNGIMFIISNSNCPLLVNRKERFFFKDLFIYFIFGCTGSSLLLVGFL